MAAGLADLGLTISQSTKREDPERVRKLGPAREGDLGQTARGSESNQDVAIAPHTDVTSEGPASPHPNSTVPLPPFQPSSIRNSRVRRTLAYLEDYVCYTLSSKDPLSLTHLSLIHI